MLFQYEFILDVRNLFTNNLLDFLPLIWYNINKEKKKEGKWYGIFQSFCSARARWRIQECRNYVLLQSERYGFRARRRATYALGKAPRKNRILFRERNYQRRIWESTQSFSIQKIPTVKSGLFYFGRTISFYIKITGWRFYSNPTISYSAHELK